MVLTDHFIMRNALVILVASIAGLSQSTPAQNYPLKPVRVVVAFAPGGGTDILARATAQKLTEAWGVSVVEIGRAHV